MTVRASVYKNKKGNTRISLSLDKDEAVKLAKKDSATFEEVAQAVRDAIKAGPRKKKDEE